MVTQHDPADPIGLFYDAAAGAVPWHEAGDALRRMAGGRSISLHLRDTAAGAVSLLFTANVPDQHWAEQSYLGHFHRLDAWTLEAMRIAAREPQALRVVTGSELIPAAQHRESEFYWDFGRRIGVFHMLGSTIDLGDGGIAALGLHRPESSPDFEQPEIDRLSLALPHLRRAFQLRRRLSAERLAAHANDVALEAFDCGAVVVDAELRVLHLNTAAERLAAPRYGLRMRAARGGPNTIGALHRAADARLRMLARSVAVLGSTGGSLIVTGTDAALRGNVLTVLVCPLPASLKRAERGAMPGRALVLLRAFERPSAPDGRMLAELFGLSASEVEVARLIALGCNAEAIAAHRQVSLPTVRTQIRAILTKSNAGSLRDFQRILSLLPRPPA